MLAALLPPPAAEQSGDVWWLKFPQESGFIARWMPRSAIIGATARRPCAGCLRMPRSFAVTSATSMRHPSRDGGYTSGRFESFGRIQADQIFDRIRASASLLSAARRGRSYRGTPRRLRARLRGHRAGATGAHQGFPMIRHSRRHGRGRAVKCRLDQSKVARERHAAQPDVRRHTARGTRLDLSPPSR
jgi:hypothetical protein